MDNPAQPSHVTGIFERPLTSDEARVLPNWLGIAWRELNRVVPGISARNARPETDPLHLATEDVQDVVVAMVERKLRNPTGTREWRGDDYSEVIDTELSAGRIYVTEAERTKLMPPAPTYGAAIYSIPLGRA